MSRSLAAPVLALTAVLALTSCTTEDEPVAPGGQAAVEAPVEPVEDPAAVLEVEDQASQGPTVRVKGAAVTAGGFVVVGSDGGKNILGFGNVPPGTAAQTLQVSLAEELTEQVELTAQLFSDDNGSGLYDAGDRPVSNGQDDEDDDAEVFAGELEVFSFTGKAVQNG